MTNNILNELKKLYRVSSLVAMLFNESKYTPYTVRDIFEILKSYERVTSDNVRMAVKRLYLSGAIDKAGARCAEYSCDKQLPINASDVVLSQLYYSIIECHGYDISDCLLKDTLVTSSITRLLNYNLIYKKGNLFYRKEQIS